MTRITTVLLSHIPSNSTFFLPSQLKKQDDDPNIMDAVIQKGMRQKQRVSIVAEISTHVQ